VCRLSPSDLNAVGTCAHLLILSRRHAESNERQALSFLGSADNWPLSIQSLMISNFSAVDALGYEFRLYPAAQRPVWEAGLPVFVRASNHGKGFANVTSAPVVDDGRVIVTNADGKEVSVRKARVTQARCLGHAPALLCTLLSCGQRFPSRGIPSFPILAMQFVCMRLKQSGYA
jgi:hypothetical protein